MNVEILWSDEQMEIVWDGMHSICWQLMNYWGFMEIITYSDELLEILWGAFNLLTADELSDIYEDNDLLR